MRILLIRLREIGDVVFTTPAIKAVRTRFPDGYLAYVVEPAAEAIVAKNPHVDRVIVAPRRRGMGGLRADIALGARLRAERYDVAIDFHGGPRASLLTWLSRAPTRIGYEVVGRSWMYSHRVERARGLRPRHSVENQWDLLAPLGVPDASRDRYPVEMALDDSAAASVAARLAVAGVNDDDALIVIHVSAGNPFRRWPMEAFAEVAASLASEAANHRVIVTSGPSDRGAAAAVIGAARAHLSPATTPRILECGEFSLSELRALVDRAALYIGGDSGPLHVAATSGVPIVALYGPTLPARSAPWRPDTFVADAVEVTGLPCRPCHQRTCEPGDFRCLTSISPAQVVASARAVLRRGGRQSL